MPDRTPVAVLSALVVATAVMVATAAAAGAATTVPSRTTSPSSTTITTTAPQPSSTTTTAPQPPSTTTLPTWPSLRPGESYGIDVASYQGQIAWPTVVADGVRFAYIKATQGTNYVNPYFAADWQSAKAAGVAYGAYEFYSLCSSGLAQAQTYLATVPQDADALPAAVDLELQGNCRARPKSGALARQLASFATAVQRATGKSVIFYVGLDFALFYPKLSILELHPLWLDLDGRPSSTAVVIWQWDSPVQMSGVAGAVDLDLANLTTLRDLRP